MDILDHVKHLVDGKWKYVTEVPTTAGIYRWCHTSKAGSGSRTWQPAAVNHPHVEMDWRMNEIETMSTTSEDRFSWSPKHSYFLSYMQRLYDYDGTGERPSYE